MDPNDLAKKVARFRRGKVPAALRREQILAEAHQLFTERGYHGASMDELARRVGVTKPVIYKLAGSKEELFRDVMAAVNAELTAAITAAAGPAQTLEAKLRAGIQAFLDFVRTHREGWLALLSAEAGPASVEVADMRRRQATIVAALLVEHIESANLAGDHRLGEALGFAVNGAVEFVASWWLSHQDVPTETLADLLTRMLAHGLLSLSDS
jgi:AcrR family transcriptional regulator